MCAEDRFFFFSFENLLLLLPTPLIPKLILIPVPKMTARCGIFVICRPGPKSILIGHLTRNTHYHTLSTLSSLPSSHIPYLGFQHLGPVYWDLAYYTQRSQAQMQSKLVQTEIRIAAGHQLHGTSSSSSSRKSKSQYQPDPPPSSDPIRSQPNRTELN